MSFLAPAFLLAFLLAIPIVLLWFFRRKREELVVPTNFLWRKALDEERISPVLKRLVTSILLFLQLLALSILVLAAAEAVLDFRVGGAARTVVLLLDTSASMGAAEADGTRMEIAKARAGELLDRLELADRAMAVAFDREARLLSGFTGDHDALRRMVANLEPRDAGSDPEEALRAAAAAVAGRPTGPVEVYLVSDGAFPAVTELPPGLEDAAFHFVGTGSAAANAGIASTRLETGLESPPRLFATVANTGPAAVSRTLSLVRGEAILDARELSIAAGEIAGAAFDLSAAGVGPYELHLEPADALPADDRAYVVYAEPPVRRILLVSDGNPVLERLRDFHPRLEVYRIPPAEVGADVGKGVGRFDLVVFDGVVPDAAVPGTGNLGPSAVYIACSPPDTGAIFGPLVENPDVVDWDRRHPLNRNVDWSDVLVAAAAPIRAGAGAATLVETTGGALVASLPGAGERIVFAFRLEDSNIALRLAFPIFFANLVDRVFHPGGGDGAGCVTAGAPIVRVLPAGQAEAVVADPTGREEAAARLPDGTILFGRTHAAGFYTVEIGATAETVAVSLLDEAEIDVAPRPTVNIAGAEIASDPGSVSAHVPLRRPLILAAVAILVAEWALWLRGVGRRRRKPAADEDGNPGNPWLSRRGRENPRP